MTAPPTAVPAARALADLTALARELGELTAAVERLAADAACAVHTRVALEQATDSLHEAGGRIAWARLKLDLVARDAGP